MNNKTSNTIFIGAIAALAFAIGLWLGTRPSENPGQVIVQDRVITVLPKPKTLQQFTLTDANDKPFTLESLEHKYSILFFGYTSCPDVCPTTLQVLANLYTNLEKKNQHRDIQVVFVSVDPKRDKAGVLKKYVNYFNSSFIGISGSESDIAGFARQLGAAYEVLDKDKLKNYPVNHTGLLFVTNPDAHFTAILSPPHDAELIESRLNLLKEIDR